MQITESIEGVRKQVKIWQQQGLSIGFVPTMGYLHEGHQSLITQAAKENDRVVVSIFVNPMQFGPQEDLEAYPRDFNRDAALCEATGAHLIFHPTPAEMYLQDFSSFVDMHHLTEGLCGKTRPTHFRGVCTVVTKLFNIVTPDRAYFGEKDAQQLAVIKQMVKDLNMPLEIIGCPIVREEDGLAKSSRNTYLSPEERKASLVLNQSLHAAKVSCEKGEFSTKKLKELIATILATEPLAKVDYIEVVDSTHLKPVEMIEGDILVAIAVYIGHTRIIDNFTYKRK